jgi:hypothetical protein
MELESWNIAEKNRATKGCREKERTKVILVFSKNGQLEEICIVAQTAEEQAILEASMNRIIKNHFVWIKKVFGRWLSEWKG